MRQTIFPNPNIPCQPGWCLAYVNEAFGVKKVYPSATAAWNASKTKHTGRDFPPGVWTPVWYGLDSTPLGHVVLLAPDGSVYSTSDLTNVPHHHPNLADLEAYYAYYGMTLTYRGWTEDVEGSSVMTDEGSAAIAPQDSTIKEMDWFDMASADDLRRVIREENPWAYKNPGLERDDTYALLRATRTYVVKNNAELAALKGIMGQLAKAQGVAIDYDKIAEAVKKAVAEGITIEGTLTANGGK